MQTDQLDILKKIEDLTNQINNLFAKKSRSVISRYPITFTLLVVFGISMVSEGIKGLLEGVYVFKNYPLTMFVAGLVVLVVTGTLYKKLDK